jgi:hypothetical protein
MFSRFEVPYDLHVQTMFGSFLLPFGLSGIHDLLMLWVFGFVHLCPTRYPVTFVSFNSHMTGVTSRAETPSHSGSSEFIPVLVGVRVAQYLVVVL